VTGWTLLTLGVLVAAVWAASGWCLVEYAKGTKHVFLSGGAIQSMTFSPGTQIRQGWAIRRHSATERWLWRAEKVPRWSVSRSFDIGVATYWSAPNDKSFCGQTCTLLWPSPLLLWTPAALLLRSGILARRRAMTGSCAKCGYSLAGLAEGSPCPECGKTKKQPQMNAD
jgi:hypothetical protein